MKPKVMILGCLSSSKGSMKSFGGAERNMAMLANALSKKGYKIYLCSVEGDNLPYELSERVNLVTYDVSYSNKVKTHLDIFKNTQKAILNYKPDIVISFWPHPTLYARLITKILGIKLLYSERNNPSKEYQGIAKFFLGAISKSCDGYIFQSKGAQVLFPDKAIKKSVVIPNPLSISQDSLTHIPLENRQRKRIVTVGRLTEQKNHRLAIEAFAEFKKTHPNYIFDIFGEGGLQEELQQLINKLGLEDSVFLKGTTTSILKEIKNSDMFIFTSIYEGLPNVLLEALALGMPIVTTDFSPGAARDLIKDGYNGLIAEFDACDIANKMSMYDDSDFAKMISQNTQTIFKTHASEEIIKKWEEFLLSMM